MRHAARTAFVTIGLAGLAWLVVFAIGRASDLQSAERTIAAQKSANAALVEAHAREKRRVVDSLSAVVGQAERARRVSERQATATLMRTHETVDSLRQILADSTQVSGDVYRNTAASILVQYDSLAQAFHDYLRADSVSHRAIDEERVAWVVERQATDSALMAWKVSSKAWEEVATCRVKLLIVLSNCPTRTQAFIGGALTALTAWVVLK